MSIIALAGAGGSHPATIAAVHAALRDAGQTTLFLDLSAFDTRSGTGAAIPGAVHVRPSPRDMGLWPVFRTTAPNLALSGGRKRFATMVTGFAGLLSAHRVSALMLCHAWGFPEQALLAAAGRIGVPVAQIDEGPFSFPIRPRDAPAFAATPRGRVQALVQRAGLLPPRDLTGDQVALFLATSPGRGAMLRQRGLPAERLAIVPAPRFDPLAETRRSWPRRARATRPRLLVLHQPFARDRKVFASEARRAEDTLAAALLGFDDCEIRIRLHPRTDPAERARVLRRFAPAAASTIADPFAELLASDLVVGFYSSMLLEAAACGAPAAAVRLDPAAFHEAFEGRKATAITTLGVPVADDAASLAAVMRRQLERGFVPPSPTLFDEHFGTLDGSGARQVAAHLIAIADGKQAEDRDGRPVGRAAVERTDLRV